MSLINDALKRASEVQRLDQPVTRRVPRMPEALMEPTVEVRPTANRKLIVIGIVIVVLAVAGWFGWQSWNARSKAATIVPTAPQTVGSNSVAAKSSVPVVPVPTPPSTTQVVKATVTTPLPIAVTNAIPATVTPTNTAVVSNHVPTVKVAVAVTNTVNPDPVVPAPPPVRTVSLEPTPISKPPPVAVVPLPMTPTPPAVVAIEPSAVKPKPVKPAAPKGPFPAVKLQGIVFSVKKPSAIVNGRDVFAGDMLDDVRVVRIERDNVLLEFHGQTNTFFLLR